jgi:hypothetical protein
MKIGMIVMRIESTDARSSIIERANPTKLNTFFVQRAEFSESGDLHQPWLTHGGLRTKMNHIINKWSSVVSRVRLRTHCGDG